MYSATASYLEIPFCEVTINIGGDGTYGVVWAGSPPTAMEQKKDAHGLQQRQLSPSLSHHIDCTSEAKLCLSSTCLTFSSVLRHKMLLGPILSQLSMVWAVIRPISLLAGI